MIKIILKLTIAVLATSSFSLYAADSFSGCSGCTVPEMKGVAVENAGNSPLSNHYVYDVENDVLNFYRVRVDFEHGVTEVYSIAPGSDVKNAVDNLMLSIEQYNTNASSTSTVNFQSGPFISLSSTEVTATSLCGHPDAVNVYDVISDDSIRQDMYNDHANIYPFVHNIASDFGTLVSVAVSVASRFELNLEPLVIPIEYTLPTGGKIKVKIDPVTENFIAISGTAKDCEKNSVPNRLNDLVNTDFKFNDTQTLGIFMSWAGDMGASIGATPTCSQNSYIVGCAKGTDNVVHCPVTCLD